MSSDRAVQQRGLAYYIYLHDSAGNQSQIHGNGKWEMGVGVGMGMGHGKHLAYHPCRTPGREIAVCPLLTHW